MAVEKKASGSVYQLSTKKLDPVISTLFLSHIQTQIHNPIPSITKTINSIPAKQW